MTVIAQSDLFTPGRGCFGLESGKKERLGVDSNPNLGHEEYSSGGDSATAQALYRACDAGGRAQQGRDHQDKGRWQEGVARQVSAKKEEATGTPQF